MAIKCGNCGAHHDSVAQVKGCHNINKGQPRATDKQKTFMRKLMAERVGYDGWLLEDDFNTTLWATLSKRQASEIIDDLLCRPIKAATPSAPQEPEKELEAGIYSRDGGVYKVYKTVHGSGRMCAKELIFDELCHAEWEYKGLATRFVHEEDRMTLEQAKEFGVIYGVCCVCGRTLTDEASIAAGIGPVCATKF